METQDRALWPLSGIDSRAWVLSQAVPIPSWVIVGN